MSERPSGVHEWADPAQLRRIRRMLRRMERLDHKPIRSRRKPRRRDLRNVRAFSAVLVGVATSAIGIAVMASGAAEMVHDGVWTINAAPVGWPSAPADAAADPIGHPPAVAEEGTFAFVAMQQELAEPVAYSPCQPIHLVVNPRRAVVGHEEILKRAVAEVSRASGLRFVFDGETDRVPLRRAARLSADGRGWEPVLVAWSDESEVPDLSGQIAGLGGSARASRGGHEWLVTGTVILDGADLAEVVQRRDGLVQAQAIVMHEFGHLLGLSHVDDEAELMHMTAVREDFGAGDRAGLSRLGSGRCVNW